MDATTAAAPTLGARPFAQADLGDPRRHRRLVQLADELTGHPGGTLPDQLQQPKTRESRLWKQGSAALPAPPAAAVWIEIADRASDLTEFLDYLEEQPKRYVVGSQHNRCVLVLVEGQPCSVKLHDWLRTLPEQGRRPIALA